MKGICRSCGRHEYIALNNALLGACCKYCYDNIKSIVESPVVQQGLQFLENEGYLQTFYDYLNEYDGSHIAIRWRTVYRLTGTSNCIFELKKIYREKYAGKLVTREHKVFCGCIPSIKCPDKYIFTVEEINTDVNTGNVYYISHYNDYMEPLGPMPLDDLRNFPLYKLVRNIDRTRKDIINNSRKGNTFVPNVNIPNDRYINESAKYIDNLKVPLRDGDLVTISTTIKSISKTIIGVFHRGRIYYLDDNENLKYTNYTLNRGIYSLIVGVEKPYFYIGEVIKAKMKKEGIIK